MAIIDFFSSILGRLFGRKCKKSPISHYYQEHITSDLIGATENPHLDKEEQQEATNVFNSQVVGYNNYYHLHRVVGQVLWSDEDTLDGDGNVSATYKVTPLHAFDNQAGHGDYYLVDATYTIANGNMYHPNHKNWHGGVQVRIGGFCLSQCDIETSIYCGNEKIDAVRLFSSSVKPETDNIEHTYTVSDSWNIGGSVTGGIKGGISPTGPSIEGSGSATFNYGVAHSKSDTYTMNDLNIRNNSDSNTARFSLINRNVVEYDWSCDNGLTDCADFAKSSLIFHACWIWYIPNVSDKDDKTKFTIKTKMNPTYKSCRFYSTKADYDEWFDTLSNEGTNELLLPNREPSGYVVLKNDTDETITNVKLLDESGNTAYESQSSYGTSTDAKFCMPTGKFTMEFKRGKTASDMQTYVYKTANTFDITRGDTLNLVGTFDFKKKTAARKKSTKKINM